ncbi:hypothetical protein HRbin23_00341 [bacterium HR23]|nr:hypothetical protein HRbin23_00341 [bacterium HR23]
MKRCWLLAMLTLGVAVLAGCGAPPYPTPPSPAPGPTPNIQATVEARVREQLTAVAQLTPTPGMPSPPLALTAETVQAIRSLVQEWEGFQQGFDAWRAGLTACTPEARRRDLRGFAVRFYSEVASRANALVPPPQAQRVAELLSDAVAKEETALRRLAEKWQPGSADAFLDYETERADVDVLRRKALQALEEARRPPTPTPRPTPTPSPIPSPEATTTPAATPSPTPRPASPTPTPDPALEAFAQAVAGLSSAWEGFRTAYDAWRERDGECKRDEVRRDLQRFVDRFRTLQGKALALPKAPPLGVVADLLAQAAQREAQALASLRDEWAPYDPAPFSRFDAQRQEADRLRRQALSALEALMARPGALR